jgi:hypothetical protein
MKRITLLGIILLVAPAVFAQEKAREDSWARLKSLLGKAKS